MPKLTTTPSELVVLLAVTPEDAAVINDVVQTFTAKYQQQLKLKKQRVPIDKEQVAALTEAICALLSQQIAVTQVELVDAVCALLHCHTELAQAIFSKHALANIRLEPRVAAAAYRHLAAFACWDHPQKAMQAYQQAIELEPTHLKCWQRYAQLLYRNGSFTQAEICYQRLLSWCATEFDPAELAHTYHHLGRLKLNQLEFQAAKEYLQKAIEIYVKLDAKKDLAKAYGNIAVAYTRCQELAHATMVLEKAIRLLKVLDNSKELAQNYLKLGLLYGKQLDFDRAIEIFEKSLQINLTLANKIGIAKVYENLGLVYLRKGDVEKSFAYHNKSLSLYQKLGNTGGMGKNYQRLSVIFRLRGEVAKAEEMLKLARQPSGVHR